jgi:two-component system nitrogen regulation response regulator GlnG
VLEAIEKPLIEQTLERTEGNQLKAARILGINRNTMRAKIKKLGIDAEKFKL